MGYTENSNINQAVYEFLKGEPINEAFHEKDRGAVKEFYKMRDHHNVMIGRHQNAMNTGGKEKDLNKHDLAIMSHMYAAKHYSGLTTYDHSGYGGNAMPVADYHNDKEFYDKIGNQKTKHANDKSKECGVSCDTESK